MQITATFKKLNTWLLLLCEGTPVRVDVISAPVTGMTQAERLRMISEEFLRLVTAYEDSESKRVKEVYADPLLTGAKPGDFCHKARKAIEEACAGNKIIYIERSPDISEKENAKRVCDAYKLGRLLPTVTCMMMALGLGLTVSEERLLPAVVAKKPKKLPQNPMEIKVPGLSQVLGKPLSKAKRGAPISTKDLRLLILYTYGRAIMAKDREESFIIRNAQLTLMDLVRLEDVDKTERLETLANQLQKQIEESNRRG